jgi:hypothetical protein
MQPLTDEQKQTVASWIQGGAKLSEIQDRLDKELGVRLTYMDVRLLADDLHVTPKDAESAAPAAPPAEATESAPAPAAADETPAGETGAPAGGGVAVAVDQVTRPGALVSGKVTFSDGQRAEWYLDQYGRLGLVAAQEGYRPSQADIADFQATLDRELVKLGL